MRVRNKSKGWRHATVCDYAQVTHSRTGRRISHGCTFVAIRIGP